MRFSVRAAALGFVIAAVLAAPWLLDRWGAGRLPVLAGVVAWRVPLTLAVWIVVVILLVLVWVRRLRPVATGFLVPAALLAGLGAVTLIADPPVTVAARASTRLTVLEWNTNAALVPAVTIVDETLRHRPDVLVLPDIDDQEYAQVAASLVTRGYSTVRPSGSDVAILSREPYREAPALAGTIPSREATAVSDAAGLPQIVAVHLPIPFTPRGSAAWNSEIGWLGAFCTSRTPTLIVGDFNATNDNIAGTPLAKCTDAAAAVGQQHAATWPTALPVALGIPIDHALTNATGPRISGFTVLRDQDRSGANHRPTLTSFDLVAGRMP